MGNNQLMSAYFAALNQIDELVFFISTELTIIEVNSAVEKFFNLSKQDFENQRISQFLNQPDEIFSFLSAKNNLRDLKIPKSTIHQKEITWDVCPIWRDENNIDCFSLIGRINTDEPRQESERMNELETIIANLPGNVYWLDKNCVQLGCNDNVLKMLGITLDEYVGKSYEELAEYLNWDWELINSFKKADLEVLATGKPIYNVEELPVKHTAGHIVNYLTTRVPLKNKAGEITGVAGISIDITERKKMNTILANIIAECTPGMLYWKDKDGVYLGCNDFMIKEAGMQSACDVVGKTDYDLWPAQAAGFRKHDLEVMRTGSSVSIEEYVTLANGENKYFATAKMPLKNTHGDIIGVIGTSLDISERKKIESEFQVAKKKAEVASQAKDEFLRNIEHQLRTPFSGIYSLALIAAEQVTDPHIKDLLVTTAQSGEELLLFINDIIDFSRSGMDRNVVLAKKFDLKQLIEKAIIIEKPAAIVKQLEISYHYPSELPSIFICDPKRLQRILLHLLSNAIKFTPKGRIHVEVRLGKQVDEKKYILQILVSDTGIGIAKEDQEFIYEQFYRVTPANQNKYEGAGLGLSVVKRLLDDLDGEIQVLSELGQGSTFICTLVLMRPLLDEAIDEESNPNKYFLLKKNGK
ncbi:Autoinducer 2 sensor kinase/phosphatase LuxQ [Legionella massiliensis]|uniref:histidine kinase n=1 Tax=Legionella massiliensis TaxID=1034943 RepID=A0A078KQ10_9GAMM|nr:PAS domain-containing protein [Legionella massiliensis]CDZ76450.1 Autoinducer 2 sensor kinase/phosphatase LuxQ [Legionella massiliensis]CEE12188.1 Autoinducer 2 sensor kinase/phosphatase LuxQ [Legionella massiliensis]